MIKLAIFVLILGTISFDASSEEPIYTKARCQQIATMDKVDILDEETQKRIEQLQSNCVIFLDGHLQGTAEANESKIVMMQNPDGPCSTNPSDLRKPQIAPPVNAKMLESRPDMTEKE